MFVARTWIVSYTLFKSLYVQMKQKPLITNSLLIVITFRRIAINVLDCVETILIVDIQFSWRFCQTFYL